PRLRGPDLHRPHAVLDRELRGPAGHGPGTALLRVTPPVGLRTIEIILGDDDLVTALISRSLNGHRLRDRPRSPRRIRHRQRDRVRTSSRVLMRRRHPLALRPITEIPRIGRDVTLSI